MTTNTTLASGRHSGGYLTAADGRKVFVTHVEPVVAPAIGNAVIIPPFGMSTSELFLPTHHLASNGFRVTRFDARDSVGRSGGNVLQYRLSTLRQDAEMVLQTIENTALPTVLMAMSLSAVVAWQIARPCAVAGVAVLVPAVDVPRTLERATGWPVAPYREASIGLPATHTIFGHEVRAAEFLADMDREGHTGLGSTCELVAGSRVPSFVVAGSKDELVELEEVRTVAAANDDLLTLSVLDGSPHEIGRSMIMTRLAMTLMTRFCLEVCQIGAVVTDPPVTDLITASEGEAVWLRSFDASSPVTRLGIYRV